MSEEMKEQLREKIIPVQIEDEIKRSYLNYAMSVIVSRALPDVRDGLKPVHRRILYSMLDLGMRSDSQTKKCADVVGHTLGKYHPHGQLSVYNALARLAQDFSIRYPLVHGQGNFGSLDGDPPAADRYTEAKLSRISEELLLDIRKNTVDFVPNYDESRKEPTVLPSAVPSLLLNGSTGIAVGLTTEIPPHNMREIIDAIIAQIDSPDISIDTLCTIVKGPDFPTGAIIKGISGIQKAYHTGKGSITIQSHFTIENNPTGDVIIFSDIPYAKQKAEMVSRLAEKVNNGIIDTIKAIRDETSRRRGVRIVIELKKSANTQITLQNIFKHTPFRSNYSINLTALVRGRPKQLTLKEAIQEYINHRKEVVTRKATFELEEAEKKAHILRGLLIALQDIDKTIELIKASKNKEEAQKTLESHFALDAVQAQAILETQLHRLTSLETQKIETELKNLETLILSLQGLLSDEKKLFEEIKQNLLKIKEKYGDDRRTEIEIQEASIANEEDLIDKEDMLVTLSTSGYIKRTPLSAFGIQNRGGKGKSGLADSKRDDSLRHLFVSNTHSSVLFITSKGRSFVLKTYTLPQVGRTAQGESIKSVLPLDSDEQISSIMVLPENTTDSMSLLLATHRGKVKKVNWSLLATSARTKRGVRAITLAHDDSVVSGEIIPQNKDLFLFSAFGRALRFPSSSVRNTGRTAAGVNGMRLKQGDSIVSVLAADNSSSFLLIGNNGYGKRLLAQNIMIHGRNTSGASVLSLRDNSLLITALIVNEDDSVTATTQQGKILRFNVSSCPTMGRSARGVNVVTVNESDTVSSVAKTPQQTEKKL